VTAYSGYCVGAKMLKQILLATLCIIAVCQRSYASIRDSLVFVKVMSTNHNGITTERQGSGILIGENGFILTVKHILDEFNPATDTIKISFKTKQDPPTIKARKFDCSAGDVDLCILYVDRGFLEQERAVGWSQVACRFPNDQEEVVAAGFPRGEESQPAQTPGKVVSQGFGIQFQTRMTANLIEGMSGGPVLDKQGNLIGVAVGRADDGSGFTFFTPVAFGKNLINAVNVSCGENATSPRSISYWFDTGVKADWSGHDIAYSNGSKPKYNIGGTPLCDDQHLGSVAVCWTARQTGYPTGSITDVVEGTNPPDWCVYKDTYIKMAEGAYRNATTPGEIYVCGTPILPLAP
jgi:hypothetical protein